MSDSDIDLLQSVFEKTEAIVAGVKPDQSELPTPCADFRVARLIDHMVGWATSFAARVSGGSFEGDPNEYRVGGDPTAEFREAAHKIIVGHRADTAEASQLPVGMLLMEFVTHGWDLATATGQQITYSDAEAEKALAMGHVMLKPEYRGPGKTFGLELAPVQDASAVERLVAFLGHTQPIA